MLPTVKAQKIARMLQRMLGEIFLQEATKLCSGALITIKAVHIPPKLGLAEVYVSCVPHTRENELMENIMQQHNVLKRLLGNKIRHKVRKVPDLRFHIDRSAAHAARIEQLITTLAIDKT